MIWLRMTCEHAEGCDSHVEVSQREGLFALLIGAARLRRLALKVGWWVVLGGRNDYCPLHLPPHWTREGDEGV